MRDFKKRYNIISSGLLQREKVLSEIISAKKNFENLSDFGWFLTLGSEALGMLSAVAASKQARALNDVIKKLENEIDILRNTKNELQFKI